MFLVDTADGVRASPIKVEGNSNNVQMQGLHGMDRLIEDGHMR